MSLLSKIQSELDAPKDKYNSFGKYSYRSCESILEAVKPLLHETKATITLSDDIVDVGGRIYVKATAVLRCSDEEHSVTAFAREAESKKGMDEAQITGAASSYARKYALNGLFAIDDTKDADATNDHGKKKQDSHGANVDERTADHKKNFLMIKAELHGALNISDLDGIMKSRKGMIESMPESGTTEIYKIYEARLSEFESDARRQ